MNVDYEWAIKLNHLSLNLMGLWPKAAQCNRQKLLCNLRTLVTFLSLTVGILVPSIYTLIGMHGNILLLIDDLQFILAGASCTIRVIIFWWKKEGKYNFIP